MITNDMRLKLVMLAFVLIASCFFNPSVSADLEAFVSVEPGALTVNVGDTFTVDISMYDDGNNIVAWHVHNFTYDNTKASIISATISDFWNTSFSNITVTDGEIDAQSFNKSGGTGGGTTTILFNITFKAIDSGLLHLNFGVDENGYTVRVQDANTNWITIVTAGAVITIEGDGGNGGNGGTGGNGGNGNGGGDGSTEEPPDDNSTENETENQYPIVDINGPYGGIVNKSIQFSSSGSFDPDGDIVSYTWNFGDGGTSDLASPTHTYMQAGSYTITLTIIDNNGSESSVGTYVVVGNEAAQAEPNNQSNSSGMTLDDSKALDFVPYMLLGFFIVIISFLIIRYFRYA